MADPTITDRPTRVPGGLMLEDGHSTIIVFASAPEIAFQEKSVQPHGDDGGDSIDVTTMYTVKYRGKAPRTLVDVTDGKSTVAWDPAARDAIRDLINVVDSITYHYPNGDAEAVWGYLKSFEPSEFTEGEQPEAEIVIVATNRDPETGEEAGPVMQLA